jgi:hypothetical protein
LKMLTLTLVWTDNRIKMHSYNEPNIVNRNPGVTPLKIKRGVWLPGLKTRVPLPGKKANTKRSSKEHLQPLRISALDYFELAKLVKPGKNSF